MAVRENTVECIRLAKWMHTYSSIWTYHQHLQHGLFTTRFMAITPPFIGNENQFVEYRLGKHNYSGKDMPSLRV
jgi:hypothetical protein